MDGGTNWRGMFEPKRPSDHAIGGAPGAPPMAREDLPDDDGREIDLVEYRPWVLQRARGRPALMLDLRRFDPKAGMWIGWAVAYPQLAAVEYVGDRMVSLDFGLRKFVVEGEGLGELVARLQQGGVIAIQEYSRVVWPTRSEGPSVSAIRRAGLEQNVVPRQSM